MSRRTPPPGQSAGWHPSRALIAIAIAARVLLVVIGTYSFGHRVVDDGYINRFQRIAESTGKPYRDFQVEYPPVALATIEGVAGSTRSSTATHFLWLSLLADAVAAGTIWRRWGSDAAGRYLFLGLPLIGWVYLGVDVLTIALAVGGVALATSGRERLGGLALTLAILTKIWPVVLLPGLLLAGRRRALRWSLVLTTTFTVAWMAWGGIGAPAQVLTFRGAPGWEVESTVGTVVWTIRGGPVVYSRDTPRVGFAPVWAKAGLLALLVVGVAAVWRVSRRDDSELWGAPALAAVSALLFAAPIFSYPYATWMGPWAAIAGARPRRPWFGLALSAAALTASFLVVLRIAPHQVWLERGILFLRNGLVGILVLLFLAPPLAAAGMARRRTSARAVSSG